MVTSRFREVERMLYQMEPTFEIGKYSELLEHIENAISSGEASLKKFQGIGLSLAILSSQRLIDSVKAVEIGVEDADSWEECNECLRLQVEEHKILMTEPVRRSLYQSD